jgi:hypothetical protein
LTHNSGFGLHGAVKEDLPPGRISRKSKKRKKASKAPNSRESMAEAAQVLSNLNENFFDFFNFAVKKFRGPNLSHGAGINAYLRIYHHG